ncbi:MULTISPECIES: hypothetical protein [unclassified Spirillospora]|uniref:hypothetical protein n=1 Tax=unclassified Spirillospora TaxID=2642701 RepID=UPI00371F8DC2
MMSDEAAQVPESPAAQVVPAPDEPEIPAVPPPDPTGDPRVDAAVARLAELGARPVSEHVEIYEDVHQRLQELLASADQDGQEGQNGQDGQDERPGQPRPAFPDALRPRP